MSVPEIRGIESKSAIMANPQLHPLELNPLTKEPFLRLRAHKNIVITPPRPSDIEGYCLIINDPRVHDWLVGPTIPHLRGR